MREDVKDWIEIQLSPSSQKHRPVVRAVPQLLEQALELGSRRIGGIQNMRARTKTAWPR